MFLCVCVCVCVQNCVCEFVFPPLHSQSAQTDIIFTSLSELLFIFFDVYLQAEKPGPFLLYIHFPSVYR